MENLEWKIAEYIWLISYICRCPSLTQIKTMALMQQTMKTGEISDKWSEPFSEPQGIKETSGQIGNFQILVFQVRLTLSPFSCVGSRGRRNSRLCWVCAGSEAGVKGTSQLPESDSLSRPQALEWEMTGGGRIAAHSSAAEVPRKELGEVLAHATGSVTTSCTQPQ